MEYELRVLENGIRVVHMPSDGKVSYCGIVVGAGSRDEGQDEKGIAHMIEHMAFKGTTHRKSFHILNRLDVVGGELNAYTTKEETVFHATFLNEYFERALELLVDITFHSVFPEKEMEKEMEVILDEINSYKDSPSEQIFDDIEDLVFHGASLGSNILGTPSCLKSIKREDLIRFIQRHYGTDNIVFCSVGPTPFKKVLRLAEKYLGDLPSGTSAQREPLMMDFQPKKSQEHKDTYQAHYIAGSIGYSLHDPKRQGLYLLNNLLGGPGMNSRLNMSLREKKGYVYNVESHFTPFSDTGIETIYFGTDEANLNKSIRQLERELELIRTRSLSSVQLNQAKKQLMGQMAISTENKENLMLGLGKSIMHFNKFDSLETVFKKIEALTASSLLEIANEVFDKDKMSVLIFK